MATLNVIRHGGGCCGVRHIQGFSSFKKADSRRLSSLAEEYTDPDGECQLLEAVVTEHQIKQAHLKEALKKAGFRCVSRFRNRNSGNICYVYHHYTKV